MKFLVSAYGCEPDKGSEPGIGWQWSLQLARFGEVWVLTRSNNRQAIEAGLRKLPRDTAEKLRFVYYDAGRLIRSIKKGERGLYPYYFCWQTGAYRKAKALCRTEKFDFCLALTFGSIWMPTFMYKLPVPFVWGPVGGGEAIPDPYLSLMGRKAALVQRLRKGLIKTAPVNPLVFRPAGKAAALIARTEDTAAILSRKYGGKLSVCLETAIDGGELAPKETYADASTVEMVYTGRLIRIKALDLAIRAMAKTKNRARIHLTVIGDGPEAEPLRKLAEKLGLEQQITFTGKKERAEVLALLRKSDVYLFPSLKEGGSWALMEAMGSGLPVICLDASGMRLTTDDECAIRIGISTAERTTDAYAAAMDRLAEDAALRERMGRHARERILTEFSWDSKGDFLRKILKL